MQTEMMTKAELAFSALDPNHTGYLTVKQLGNLSNKLSTREVEALMVKVNLRSFPVSFFCHICLLMGLIPGWRNDIHSIQKKTILVIS